GVPADKILRTVNNKNWFMAVAELIKVQKSQKMQNVSLWTYEQYEIITKQVQRILQLLKECKEKNRVEIYRPERGSKIKSQTWQQAKSTQKYKRYELRIYGDLVLLIIATA
ncbi:MAG: hypothetical protein K2G55_10560, partial [Lachnospiraceae bacterium]|nr:hypothetical protein [Lachnospiraceae bacterium]